MDCSFDNQLTEVTTGLGNLSLSPTAAKQKETFLSVLPHIFHLCLESRSELRLVSKTWQQISDRIPFISTSPNHYVTLLRPEEKGIYRKMITVPVISKESNHITICLPSGSYDMDMPPRFMKVPLQHVITSVEPTLKYSINGCFDSYKIFDESDREVLIESTSKIFRSLKIISNLNTQNNSRYNFEERTISIIKNMCFLRTFSEACTSLKRIINRIETTSETVTLENQEKACEEKTTFRFDIMSRIVLLQEAMIQAEELNSILQRSQNTRNYDSKN